MTLTAITFAITNRGASMRGLGVICPGARYASVLVAGEIRLRRCHASASQWKEIERLIETGVETALIATGVFHGVLTGSAEDLRVRWLHVMPVEISDPLGAVQALDSHLKTQPLELHFRIQQN